MKKRAGLAVGLILIIACGVIWFEPTHWLRGRLTGEGFFEGRSSTAWAAELARGPAERAAALKALETPAAVPVLRDLVATPRSGEQAEVRWTAAELLGKIGPEAQAAEPELMAALADPDPRLQAVAVAALPKIGARAESAVPALASLLDTRNAVVAARALATYKAEARAAVPQLIATLSNGRNDTETRWNAARTLGKIGPDSLPALSALSAATHASEATLREHAAEAIGEIGPTAAEGVQALVAVLSDENTRVRRDAVRALGQLGTVARSAGEQIVRLLDDPEAIVREAAEVALDKVAPELRPEKTPSDAAGVTENRPDAPPVDSDAKKPVDPD